MSTPSAPQIVIRPRATDQTLQFYWAAPLSDGGSPITGYVLECAAESISHSLGPTEGYYKETGLTNYQDYTFTIYATNTNGNGAVATFRTVQPGFVPDAPTDVSATLLDGSAVQVTWTNPAYSGRLGWNVIKAIPQEGGATVVFATYGYISNKTVGGGFDYTKTYRFLVQGVTDTGYAAPTSLSQVISFSGGGGGQATMVAGGTQFAPASLAYSTDNGVTWTVSPSAPFTKDCNGIAYNGYLWVAVGEGVDSIAISPDGINWTGLGQSTFSGNGRGIAWNGEVFVAVGQGTNTLAYSYDGDTWVGLGSTIFGSVGKAVAWNGHMFVACGDTSINTFAYSTDGVHWYGNGNSIFASTGGLCLAWSGSRWVAGSEDTDEIAYSDDGINWIETSAGLSETCNSIAWNGQYFVAVGGTGPDSMAYSTDASNWTVVTNGDISNNAFAVIWNGSAWVVGSDTGIWSTTDISGTWTNRSATFLTKSLATTIQLPYTVKYVASSGSNLTFVSSDARIWSQVAGPTFDNIYSVASGYDLSGEEVFALCGYKVTPHQLAFSKDGVNWTMRNFMADASSVCFAAAYGALLGGPKVWCAIGNDVSGYFSDDMFVGNIVPFDTGLTTRSCIAYGRDVSGRSIWMLGGSSGSGPISRFSYNWGDGGVAPPTVQTYVANGDLSSCDTLAWDGRRWLAGGDSSDVSNSMIYSDDDGVTWTGLGTSTFTVCNGIATNGHVWVATGSGPNTIAYSLDGTVWEGLGTQYAHVSASSIIWTNGQWVVGCLESSGNTVFTSLDGRVWTGRGNTVDYLAQLGGREIKPYTKPTWLVSGLPYNPNPGVTSLSMMVSYDLSGTTFRGNEFATANGESAPTTLVFNGTEWAALVGGSSIYTSENAIHWRSTTGRVPIYPVCMATDGRMWVVGQGGQTVGNLLYSFDGKKWSISPSAFHQNSNLTTVYAVAAGKDTSGNPLWVAVGDISSNHVCQSSDGINWTLGNLPYWQTASFSQRTDIAFGYDSSGATRWVGVSSTDPSGYGILSSPDGYSWSPTTPANLLGKKVAYNGRRWVVAAGDISEVIYTSEDGIHWVSAGQEIWGSLNTANDFAWNGQTWIGTSLDTDKLVCSTDDISWNTTRNTFGLGLRNGIAARVVPPYEVRWVVVGNNDPYIYISPDGVNYTGILNTPFDGRGQSIRYGRDASGNPLWLAGSRSTNGNKIAISSNGIAWEGISVDITRVHALAYGIDSSGEHIWALGGYDGFSPTHTLAIYKNGAITELGATILTDTCWGISFGYDTSGEGIFIATGSGTNTIAWSRDAIHWNGLGTSIFADVGWASAYNGERWVAVGEGTNTIASSLDGIHWTGQGTSVFTSVGYSIAWDGVRFVASGSSAGNQTAVSTDGLIWKSFESENDSNDLATDGSVYVSANDSQPFLGYSYDGVNWKYVNIPTTRLNGAATNKFILPFQTRRG